MLDTAIQLMQSGITPSVSDVSEAAGVSRATAYRYFPNQAALVQLVIQQALGPIMKWKSASETPVGRVTDLLEFSMPHIESFEATFRAVQKLSLEQWAARQSGATTDEGRIIRGHRIALLEGALEPLRSKIPKQDFERLIHGLSLIFGIEAITIMKDICGLDGTKTTELAVWVAQALVQHATADLEKEIA